MCVSPPNGPSAMTDRLQSNLSCVLLGPGKVRFERRPTPQIVDPHDVLVQIGYVGVCGISEESPLVMGHEASGTVHSVGSAVTRLKPGDRVAIEPGIPCRRCNRCKSGKYNLCPRMRFAADLPKTDGTLCHLFKVPEDFAYKIPDSLSLQEAVLVEPLSVAVHGVRLADLKAGQTVLVQGSGTIGLLAAATAKAYGAKAVFIADINETKLGFAKSFGYVAFVSDTSSTPFEDAERFKKEACLEDGVDIVLECTGVESSAQTGIYASAPGGTMVQIGMGKFNQSLPLGAMCEKETVLKTAFRYGPGDYDIALELLVSGKVSVKAMISSIVPFEDAPKAWERTRKGEGIKNLIEGVHV
ncbi:D-xylulose reductase A [Purpureocillium lilacinum]|uniref:L-arabinitol 4-dehydrogenase n=1 Tax=Purpureocillium lilacinum TaxID=33203 RepID=A0A179HI45_PURLI|nr:D-xylulose reductase A [Purpureocillium lilacinum]OAQ90106.1 D-xylulose reductase A [Purpureocillium lilacinum]